LRVRLEKKGIRVLGIAESFRKGLDRRAVLAGVVMRMDLIIDGVIVDSARLGGWTRPRASWRCIAGLRGEIYLR